MSEFDARAADYQQAIEGLYAAMRLAASQNRQAGHYSLKAQVRALREELHEALQTGQFADGVQRDWVRRHTGELKVGDVVLTYGMRIRVNSITEHQPSALDIRQGSTLPYWACHGTVLNLDEVREGRFVPMSWLCTRKWVEGEGWVIDRRDFWNVQGNELATWTVERQAAASQT